MEREDLSSVRLPEPAPGTYDDFDSKCVAGTTFGRCSQEGLTNHGEYTTEDHDQLCFAHAKNGFQRLLDNPTVHHRTRKQLKPATSRR